MKLFFKSLQAMALIVIMILVTSCGKKIPNNSAVAPPNNDTSEITLFSSFTPLTAKEVNLTLQEVQSICNMSNPSEEDYLIANGNLMYISIDFELLILKILGLDHLANEAIERGEIKNFGKYTQMIDKSLSMLNELTQSTLVGLEGVSQCENEVIKADILRMISNINIIKKKEWLE